MFGTQLAIELLLSLILATLVIGFAFHFASGFGRQTISFVTYTVIYFVLLVVSGGATFVGASENWLVGLVTFISFLVALISPLEIRTG